TPLHDAAERGRPEMLTILLEAGADVNAKDIHGMTPLDIVGAENKTEKERILKNAKKKK
ncbi:MAG: ankyrin repeat domain-containing protein, partial [Planctomycetaceae bacterium]|nr:ankyrin repeat domain-containing protein [Planctomycetaceae bacterium]